MKKLKFIASSIAVITILLLCGNIWANEVDRPQEAIIAIKKGNYDKAITSLKKAILTLPNDITFHNDLGVAYACNGLYHKSIEEFEKALILEKGNDKAFIYYNLANVLQRLGKMNEANKNFDLAEKSLPEFKYPEILKDFSYRTISLASFITDVYREDKIMESEVMDDAALYKQLEKGEKDYMPFLYLYHSPSTYVIKALSLNLMSKKKEALASYQKALAVIKKMSFLSRVDKAVACEARLQISDLLFDMGKLNEAISVLEEAKKVNPKRIQVYEGLGFLYIKQNDYGNALINIDEALRRNPSSKIANGLKQKIQQIKK